MKLLVTGSRTLVKTDGRLLLAGLAVIQDLAGWPTLVLHGGALGVDSQADTWAKSHGIPVEELRPDYDLYPPKVAPLMRNLELVKRAEWVLAVYAPGQDRRGGTWYTVKAAVKVGLPVVEVLSDGRIEVTTPSPKLF